MLYSTDFKNKPDSESPSKTQQNHIYIYIYHFISKKKMFGTLSHYRCTRGLELFILKGKMSNFGRHVRK